MKSAAVLAVLIAVASFSRGEGHVSPARPLPGTMATLHPADGLGAIGGAAGDAWVDDRWSERLLRLDHRTGRVVARIPVDGRVALASGAGALWALQRGGGYGRFLHGPLLRIDPATNRVTARITIPVLAVGVTVAGDDVWVWARDRLVRIDPRTNGISQVIATPEQEHGLITGFTVVGDEALITTADGHLVRFDRRSGAQLGSVEIALRFPELLKASSRGLIVEANGSVAVVDPETGAVRWRTRLGYRVGRVIDADGALWVYGANIRDPGDRVWKLDADTGAVLGSVLLPAFSTTGMVVIGTTLWVTTAGGRVFVLRR